MAQSDSSASLTGLCQGKSHPRLREHGDLTWKQGLGFRVFRVLGFEGLGIRA